MPICKIIVKFVVFFASLFFLSAQTLIYIYIYIKFLAFGNAGGAFFSKGIFVFVFVVGP